MPKKTNNKQLAEFARRLGASLQATYNAPTAVQPSAPAPMTPYQASLAQQAAQLQAQQNAMFASPPAVQPAPQGLAAQAQGMGDEMRATFNSPTAIQPEKGFDGARMGTSAYDLDKQRARERGEFWPE